jgi:hypothetical protein
MRGALFADTFSPVLTNWMAKNRSRFGLETLYPGQINSLRRWIQHNGILGAMADQGREATRWNLTPQVRTPWPMKLLQFCQRQGVIIQSVQECPNQVYSNALKFGPSWDFQIISLNQFRDEFSDWAHHVISESPLHYDWSYPKLEVLPQPGFSTAP